MGIRSQVMNRGKSSFDQSLMYIHPFPLTVTPIFLAPFQLSRQKNYSYVEKNIGEGGICPPPTSALLPLPKVTLMAVFVCYL